MKNASRIAAGLILGLSGASFGALWFRDSIEAHELSRVLRPGFDAFGRNCATLTLSTIAQTLITLAPVLVLCLVLSIGVALIAASRPERVRFVLRSSLDLVSALPGFLLALSLGVLFPDSAATFYLGAMLMVAPTTIRYFESQLLKVSGEDFVLAAEAMGAGRLHLWLHHYLPVLRASMVVILPFLLIRLILIETSLSFLGLASVPGHETWGRLLAQGKDYLLEAPWILGFAATPLCLLIGSFHLLGIEEKT